VVVPVLAGERGVQDDTLPVRGREQCRAIGAEGRLLLLAEQQLGCGVQHLHAQAVGEQHDADAAGLEGVLDAVALGAQRPQRLDLLGHVLPHAEVLHHPPGVVVHRGERHLVPERGPVRAVVEQRLSGSMPLAQGDGEAGARRGSGAGALQQAAAPSEDALRRVAGEALEGRVDVHQREAGTPGVGQRDARGHRVVRDAMRGHEAGAVTGGPGRAGVTPVEVGIAGILARR
jgi:hypothetical protein